MMVKILSVVGKLEVDLDKELAKEAIKVALVVEEVEHKVQGDLRVVLGVLEVLEGQVLMKIVPGMALGVVIRAQAGKERKH